VESLLQMTDKSQISDYQAADVSSTLNSHPRVKRLALKWKLVEPELSMASVALKS